MAIWVTIRPITRPKDMAAGPRTERFDILVCYDVETVTDAGKTRLRKVSKACVSFGQRVQYSVFECNLSEALFFKLRSKLLDIMDLEKDSLRIYFLRGRRQEFVEVHGRDGWVDFSGPLTF